MAIKRAIKAGNKSIISFKKVIKVGEITQLVNSTTITSLSTISGVGVIHDGKGTIHISGTAQSGGGRNSWGISFGAIKGHKYLTESFIDDATLFLSNYTTPSIYQFISSTTPIFEFTKESGKYRMGWNLLDGKTYNVDITPQLFDLTEMFGAGHEPATVAEFKAKFPEAYYPYQRAVLTVYNKVVRPCARKGEVVQLFNKNTYFNTQTKSGITATNNGDGSWTINGTATKSYYINFSPALTSIIGGHKILICGNKENSNFEMGLLNQPIQDTGTGVIGIFNQSAGKTWGIAWVNGAVINNVTIYPQLFDLTAMYGEGNEPKSLAEFRKDFPESYYPYSPIQTKNLFDIRKYTGLINGFLNNLPASYFVKNLTQNSLTIKTGVYGNSAFLKEPIILSAGTYTFSCDCDYDAIYNRGGVHLMVSKKNKTGTSMTTIGSQGYQNLHRLVLTFTLAEETEVYLSLQGDGGPANYTNLNNVFFNIQLEKGSVATDYVPHDYI